MRINPSASDALDPLICNNEDMIINKIKAHNKPAIVDKIAAEVFLLWPLRSNNVTAVDRAAHKILMQIGEYPEKTAGRTRYIIKNYGDVDYKTQLGINLKS